MFEMEEIKLTFSYVKNIKVSILEKIETFITEEAEEFGVAKNKYLTEIFKNFDFEYVPQKRSKIYTEKTKYIQFTVPKEALEKYEILEKRDIVIADYCRDMLDKFLALSKVKREQIILKDRLEMIKEAISKNMRLDFTTKNGTSMVEPYEIIEDITYDKNYIICYKEELDGVVTYSLRNIKNIKKRKDFQEYYYVDMEIAKNNFDPFLSYDSIVKIKITPEGEKIFNRKKQLRPKVLKKEKDIWELQCTSYKALLYFISFFDEVEILEPESLRKTLIEKINKMYELYNEK